MQLNELTVHGAHALLKKKEISSAELTRAVLDRIDNAESKIDAYITVLAELALSQAKAADARIAVGEMGPLTGIPIAIKDLICTKNVRTTCASQILKDFIPPYDATVMTKLKAAGAVMVGKTNMDEFAMGSSTENSGIKPTKNPWDPSRIPGGSSGGSAAAVSADMCLAALGSDTGGSIRQPASHCGVVGMKPTYGRVSRFGLVAFASSLDQIGPFAKNVRDCAILMNAICGHDAKDSTSVPKDVPDYSAVFGEGLKGMRIGLPIEYHKAEGVDGDVATSMVEAVKVLEGLGAEIVEVSLPHTRYGVAAYYVIAPSEASSNLARYDGVKYGFRNEDAQTLAEMYDTTRSRGFGPEVQRRIILGTYALSAGYYDAYYKKASQVRSLIIKDFKESFEKCDLILGPVAPSAAPKIGAMAEDPLAMYMSDVFTLPANLAGLPGISLPCGFSKENLPIGLQLMGKHFDEETLLKVAFAYEQATTWHQRKPKL